MIVLLLSAAWAVDCDAPTRALDIRTSLDEAYRQLEALDIAAFKEATNTLDAVVPCLSEALPPPVIAEIHRTKGIRAFGERDDAAPLMFAAARSIEPGYRFPYNLIPDGNPIRDVYLSLDTSQNDTAEVPRPGAGDLRIDGYSSNRRPNSWPTLVQYLRADGTVDFTVYLAADQPIPDYPLVVMSTAPMPAPLAPVTGPLPGPKPTMPPPARSSARVPLLVAAGVTGIGASVAYGLAGARKSSFQDPGTPDNELDSLRSQANTLVIVGAFGGAAALGLGVAGITAK